LRRPHWRHSVVQRDRNRTIDLADGCFRSISIVFLRRSFALHAAAMLAPWKGRLIR